MSGKEQNAANKKEQATALRHPAVIAALITAVAAGVFGLLSIIIEPEFWADWRRTIHKDDVAEQPVLPSTQPPPAETRFDFGKGSWSNRLTEIQRALRHRVAGKPDVDTRRRAITALVTLSGEHPPEIYYRQATELLIEYVRDNIEERRAPGEQVIVDPRPPVPVYRPLDIIDALQGLQDIRRASGERVQVAVGGIDFQQISLSKLDFEGFYFGHADFSHAHLSDCSCRSADFRHARFQGAATWGRLGPPADFRDTNFQEADLAGSKWVNVDFEGSNIEEAKGHRQVADFRNINGLTEVQRALFE